MSPKRSASACGKFILAGEHSIVRGGVALCLPLKDLKLNVHLHAPSDSRAVNVNGTPLRDPDLGLVHQLFDLYGIDGAVDIRTAIPIGSGLGSSAALCTALARARYAELDEIEIAEKALLGEKLFHQSPSGVDPYTIALESAIAFRAFEEETHEHVKEYIDLELESFREEKLIFTLFDSGIPHRTSEVQARVAQSRQSEPKTFDATMRRLQDLAFRCHAALEYQPREELGAILAEIQDELCALGVSHPRIEATIEAASKLKGFMGAKLTGAGCGGFVLALFDQAEARKNAEYAVWENAGLIFS